MEAIRSSETIVLTRATLRNIPEDAILEDGCSTLRRKVGELLPHYTASPRGTQQLTMLYSLTCSELWKTLRGTQDTKKEKRRNRRDSELEYKEAEEEVKLCPCLIS
jgi:hypothetical protein